MIQHLIGMHDPIIEYIIIIIIIIIKALGYSWRHLWMVTRLETSPFVFTFSPLSVSLSLSLLLSLSLSFSLSLSPSLSLCPLPPPFLSLSSLPSLLPLSNLAVVSLIQSFSYIIIIIVYYSIAQCVSSNDIKQMEPTLDEVHTHTH